MPSSRSVGAGPDAWEILARLWELIQGVLDDSAAELEATGLNAKSFFLLAAVEEHPFPAELARRMHLPPPTVTYLVKQLEAIGYLERRAEPGDLRKFRLIVTETGVRAMARGREAMGAVLGERLARLEPDERAGFDRTVGRLSAPKAD